MNAFLPPSRVRPRLLQRSQSSHPRRLPSRSRCVPVFGIERGKRGYLSSRCVSRRVQVAVATSAVANLSATRQPRGDADFQMMGTLIERYRDVAIAVLGTISPRARTLVRGPSQQPPSAGVSALGSAYALARSALKHLATPGVLASLHFLITSAVVFMLDRGHVYPFELKALPLQASPCALSKSRGPLLRGRRGAQLQCPTPLAVALQLPSLHGHPRGLRGGALRLAEQQQRGPGA